MPNFKTHLVAGLTAGIAYGGLGYYMGVPASGCLLSAGLLTGASLLPDVDTNSVPLRELSSFLGACAAIITAILCQKHANEYIVLFGISAYLFVRFILTNLLLKCTVHRGITHSVIMALLMAEISLLLFSGSFVFFKAGAVFVGFLLHLLLDEISSKNGTAFKLWGHNWIANAILVTVVIALAFANLWKN